MDILEREAAHEAALLVAAYVAQYRASQPWFAAALCAGHAHPEWWFPAGGRDRGDRAYAHCEVCPVREACLDAALEDEHQCGIWGGLSERARRKEKRRRREARRG